GRISEILGPVPIIKKIDTAIRTVDFLGAGRRSIKRLHPQSKAWINQFKKGLNWYIKRLNKKPVTNRFIGQDLKPYSIEELLAIGKLSSSDLSWIIYLTHLQHASTKDGEKAFSKYLEKLKTDIPSHNNPEKKTLTDILKLLSQSGSNTLVISGKKTKSGSAMIASDPHVGILLPNFWLIMGIKSPGYHAVGLMLPGIPIIGVGRNQHISWGGTNIRGISSHLYDVSDLKEEEFKIRTEKIKRRGWFSSEVKIKETSFGPVITDLHFFKPQNPSVKVALHWIGREGTDELKAFLDLMKSKNWSDFKKSFTGYKIPAMAMLYADTKGNIGLIPAYGQPILKNPKNTLDLIKSKDNPVIGILPPTKNLNIYNPKKGFIASANNKPFKNPTIPFSFSYPGNHRVLRLTELAKASNKIDVNYLKKLQLDVFSKTSFELKNLLIQKIKSNSDIYQSQIIQKLESWNGHYASHSSSAVVFYSLMSALWSAYTNEIKNPILKKLHQSNDNWKSLLLKWLDIQSPEKIYSLVKEALPLVKKTSLKYPAWGDFTEQTQRTILGRIPVIGSKFNLDSYPGVGENDTLNKSGRSLSQEKAKISYGASARHISDMADPDKNYFILHGGQDSWLMNENLADQTKLWRKGEYIKIPLTMEKVESQFTAFQSVIDILR
ncbi:MAG: penicillin acylase family protein, partial [Bdellovibrionales bacterium]|nr:penicillin acylase family protein [Bdellovibrionales bacterium]